LLEEGIELLCEALLGELIDSDRSRQGAAGPSYGGLQFECHHVHLATEDVLHRRLCQRVGAGLGGGGSATMTVRGITDVCDVTIISSVLRTLSPASLIGPPEQAM
jgi:hypothetical protein